MTEVTACQIVESAQELIRDPEHWTQGVSARDASGNQVIVTEGVSFCAIGALDRAAHDLGTSLPTSGAVRGESPFEKAFFALTKAAREHTDRPTASLSDINDDYRHDPVVSHKVIMAIYDRAKETLCK